MNGTLYIVATPIGNLSDISPRAAETLREASCVLAEDTRVAGKLLAHLAIKTTLERFDANSSASAIVKIIDRLKRGENIALVSDAGTPAISDPGAHLVDEIVRALGQETKIVPIPGPSAITSALSVSGFYSDRFSFFGFPPPKKGRGAYIKKIADAPETSVFFESPHRIRKTLAELAAICPERRAVVCRELTKMFETVHRGTVRETAAANGLREQGEFVVVLGPQKGLNTRQLMVE